MKTFIKRLQWYLIFSSGLLLIGCGVTKNTFYLQGINIDAPIKQLPLHITNSQKEGSVTISPKLSISGTKIINGRVPEHTLVNSEGIYQLDTVSVNGHQAYRESSANQFAFNGDNMSWSPPDFTAGVNFDYCAGNHVALALGMDYSSKQSASLLGLRAGLGFFQQKGNSAFRIDVGLAWQDIKYEAFSVLKSQYTPYGGTTQDPIIIFFRDIKKENYMNPYFSLTYNTCFPDNPVNFALSLGYFSQTLFDFQPEHVNFLYYPASSTTINEDLRGDGSVTFVEITPAVYFDLNESMRIIGGIKILKETQLESISNSVFINPIVQLDMHF